MNAEPTPPPAAADDGLCDVTPGVAGAVCDGLGSAFGGGVDMLVGGGARAALDATVAFVVDGAGWVLTRLVEVIEKSTSPSLTSDWFGAAYADMALVGALGILPFLLLALIQALFRQAPTGMVFVVFGLVPLAAVGTAGAVVVVDMLVRLTDELTAWIARGMGSDLSAFAEGVGSALVRTAQPGGVVVAGFAALVGAAIVAFVAFVIWLELLLRQAAIYVAVLFFPLGFMAMVWPVTAHWLRRLVQGLVAIILSKFVIVAVMALATNAVDADVPDEGFGVVLAGGALLSLAALAPYVLLRLIPVFDAGMSSQLEGTFRRPTAAVATPVHGNQVGSMLRQRMHRGTGARHAGPAPAHTAAAAPGVGGVALVGTAAAAADTGAAASAGRRASRTVTTATGTQDAGARPTSRAPTSSVSPSNAASPNPGQEEGR